MHGCASAAEHSGRGHEPQTGKNGRSLLGKEEEEVEEEKEEKEEEKEEEVEEEVGELEGAPLNSTQSHGDV